MELGPPLPPAEEIGTLVSIGRIAKQTPYSPDFLRQLARSGKLRAYCRSRRPCPDSFCVHMVRADGKTAIRAIGPTLTRLRHCHRPSTHQAHKQSTTGRITVEDLLAIASAAKSKVNP